MHKIISIHPSIPYPSLGKSKQKEKEKGKAQSITIIQTVPPPPPTTITPIPLGQTRNRVMVALRPSAIVHVDAGILILGSGLSRGKV